MNIYMLTGYSGELTSPALSDKIYEKKKKWRWNNNGKCLL